MEITDDTYVIALHPGENQNDFYGMVTEVVDEFITNDQIFVARLSDTQVIALGNDDRVIGIDNMAEMDASIEEDADNTLPANRASPYNTSSIYVDRGNWALHRHTSLTNNFTAENTDHTMSFTYPQDGGVDVDGTGVDIVACIQGVPDITNAGYKDSGVSRIQEYQWNTLTGLSGQATIDYNTKTPGDHGEAVLAFACHNTYGWAKGAKIYIMPRTWESNVYWWEAVRLFHKAKVDAGGSVRPTVFIASFGYSSGHGQFGFRKIQFRGTDYTTARGLLGMSRSGPFQAWKDFGMPIAIRLSEQDTVKTLVTNMENEGVFNVISAGNKAQKHDVPGGPDYDNTIWGGREATEPSPPRYTNRDSALAGPNTIIVGNMNSAFNSIVSGKETLWDTSSKGPRVDCVMGGANLTLDKTHWGSTGDYVASGTSFTAPQVAGILAMVLQKYPSTTQAQARKYFREHAIGTDTLYDPGISPTSDAGDYGDPEYFGNPLALNGYSGNILYLDPAMAFDPSTITNTTIIYPTETLVSSKLNYTISQINQKLSTLP